MGQSSEVEYISKLRSETELTCGKLGANGEAEVSLLQLYIPAQGHPSLKGLVAGSCSQKLDCGNSWEWAAVSWEKSREGFEGGHCRRCLWRKASSHESKAITPSHMPGGGAITIASLPHASISSYYNNELTLQMLNTLESRAGHHAGSSIKCQMNILE